MGEWAERNRSRSCSIPLASNSPTSRSSAPRRCTATSGAGSWSSATPSTGRSEHERPEFHPLRTMPGGPRRAWVSAMATVTADQAAPARKERERRRELSPAERAAKGKRARSEVPRKAQALWEPPPDRRDPVEILSEQEATRVPELLPIRHERMGE